MKSKQRLKNVTYLIIFVLSNLSFVDAKYYDTPKYFFAKLDESDSTFTIILDGYFFGNIRKDPHKHGNYVINPTTKFEVAFTKNFYANPNFYSLHQINNSTMYKINCESNVLGYGSLKIGSPFVIVALSNDGSGKRISTKIESFYYNSVLSTISGWPISYLIAKTDKIEDILGFEKKYHVAIYQGYYDNDIESPVLIDTNIPELVKMKMDSVSDSKVEHNNKIKEEFKDRGETERTIRRFSYKTEIQPFESSNSQNTREKRYILFTYLFAAGYAGETYLVNENGQILKSIIQHSNGKFAKCEGIIRTQNYDLVVLYNSVGKYSGGLSLLKQDDEGILKEILFLGTVSD